MNNSLIKFDKKTIEYFNAVKELELNKIETPVLGLNTVAFNNYEIRKYKNMEKAGLI